MLHDGYMAVAGVAVGYTAAGDRDTRPLNVVRSGGVLVCLALNTAYLTLR